MSFRPVMKAAKAKQLTSTDQEFELKNADPSVVSRWLVHVTPNTPTGGSITVHAKIAESEHSAAYIGARAYLDLADYTWKATAITSFPANFVCEGSGLDVKIVDTTLSAGGLYVEAIPLRG